MCTLVPRLSRCIRPVWWTERVNMDCNVLCISYITCSRAGCTEHALAGFPNHKQKYRTFDHVGGRTHVTPFCKKKKKKKVDKWVFFEHLKKSILKKKYENGLFLIEDLSDKPKENVFNYVFIYLKFEINWTK